VELEGVPVSLRHVILNAGTVCLAGLASCGLVMEVYDSGKQTGLIEGQAQGFEAGLKARKDPPKIIIITPRPDGSFVAPKKEADKDSVLWRI
jgi:hypothetical protein